jgi:hypothetical protein
MALIAAVLCMAAVVGLLLRAVAQWNRDGELAAAVRPMLAGLLPVAQQAVPVRIGLISGRISRAPPESRTRCAMKPPVLLGRHVLVGLPRVSAVTKD